MPVYLYACPVCARKREVVKPIAELNRKEHCLNCEAAMNRQICAPAVRGDYAGYSCPVTGKWIEGRRAHEENLKRTGCRVLEPGESDNARRASAAADAALDQAVESTVEEFVETLPSDKKERLAAEMEHGLDVQVSRN